jgi:hypothetical protein
VRKNADIGGGPAASTCSWSTRSRTRYIDCKEEPLPYGERLVDDVINRTETAMPQPTALPRWSWPCARRRRPTGSARDLTF